jgi:hypothetical protein
VAPATAYNWNTLKRLIESKIVADKGAKIYRLSIKYAIRKTNNKFIVMNGKRKLNL